MSESFYENLFAVIAIMLLHLHIYQGSQIDTKHILQQHFKCDSHLMLARQICQSSSNYSIVCRFEGTERVTLELLRPQRVLRVWSRTQIYSLEMHLKIILKNWCSRH